MTHLGLAFRESLNKEIEKNVPCFYRVLENREEVLGEREMLWEHEPTYSFFESSSPELPRVFL